MASLDDIPTLPPTTPTSDDLIAIIDGADRRSPKRVSLAQVGSLIGTTNLAPGDVSPVIAPTTLAIATRVTVVVGGIGSTVSSLPPASGSLRELFIINDSSSGTTTLPTLGAGTEAIDPQTSAHLISDGVSWYRVS